MRAVLAAIGVLLVGAPIAEAVPKITPSEIKTLADREVRATCKSRELFKLENRPIWVKTHHCRNPRSYGAWHPPLRPDTGYAVMRYELVAVRHVPGVKDIWCRGAAWYRKNRDLKIRRLGHTRWACREFRSEFQPATVPPGLEGR